VRNIMEKLMLHTRLQLASWAHQQEGEDGGGGRKGAEPPYTFFYVLPCHARLGDTRGVTVRLWFLVEHLTSATVGLTAAGSGTQKERRDRMPKRPVTTLAKKPVWAYAYQIVPPQTQDRLDTITALLEQEQEDARNAARTWQSRLVAEEHVTHILVVSDSPAQDLEVNQRVEGALRAMDVGFSVTAPMPVEDEPPP
jgi:hypothetical protein